MHFCTALLAILSATTVMGGVIPQGPGHVHLGPSNKKTQTSMKTTAESSDGGTDDYEFIWVGGVIEAPPANDRFVSVSAKIIAPNPRFPADDQGGIDYGAAAWLGIDGYNNLFVLQIGFLFRISAQGVISYDACYEVSSPSPSPAIKRTENADTLSKWYPGLPECVYIKEITINPGDALSLSVESADGTAGTVTIENETRNQQFSMPLTAHDQSEVLLGQNAEWIVEEYQSTGKPRSQPPDFGSLEFTEATAKTRDGLTLTPADGKLVDWAPKLSGSIGPGTVTITYTGEDKDCSGAAGQSESCPGPGNSGNTGG
ncbi:peptidase A4 family-domain-containing protein [Phyllosticta citribraziliensis]